MENNQRLPEHLSGKYEGSFAYLTIKDRLPVILVKVVDYLCRDKNEIVASYGEAASEEVKKVIGRLSALQNEMVTNKPILPICDNNDDTQLWNEYLQNQKLLYTFTPAWFDSSWLYSECYFYRRIRQAFLLSTCFTDFDHFRKQKEESFFSTLDAVTFLCSALYDTLSELENSNNESKMYNFFRTYLEASLWGNKFDLSITSGKASIAQSNPLSELDHLRENIAINQTENIYEILVNANKSKKEVTVDFILDNAGFELFCDLCCLQFLLSSKLATKINIYPKTMPWFISDTLEKDITWLLHTISQNKNKNLVRFSQDCSARIQSGQWHIIKEKFWTLPHDFSEMQSADPQLYQKLSYSDLIIFKGDLNYRKLIGDRQWNEATTFKEALNGFFPSNVAALRTIKSDVTVGLKPGTSEEMSKKSQNWQFSGDYGLIQCYKKET